MANPFTRRDAFVSPGLSLEDQALLSNALIRRPRLVRVEPCGCRLYDDGTLRYVPGHDHARDC